MFCSYCGKELPEGAAFCSQCGKALAVQEVTVEETPAAEVLAEEPAVAAEETTVVQETDVMQQDATFPTETPAPAVETAEEPAPKKRRFPLKWLIAALVAVVAVGALLLNMSTIVGTVIKIFGSDTDYYRYVELKAVKNGTDTVADYYGLIKDTFTDDEKKVQGSFRPVLGDEAKELLKDLPADVNLDWLNDLEVSYTGNYKDNAVMLELAVAVADGDPLKAVGILNSTDGKLFASLPSVSDTYLEFDMNSAVAPDSDVSEGGLLVVPPSMSANSVLDGFLTDNDLMDDLRDVLPSDKELDKLLDRYFAVALDMVEVSAADKAVLTIGGVEQKCTVSTIEITQKQCLDIVAAVLREAKSDKDIKSIIADVQEFIDEKVKDEKIDLYAEYTAALDDMLASLKSSEDNATNDVFAVMTTYISQQHEIIGRRIALADAEVLYYATAQKGSAFATEMKIANVVKLSGKGTKKGDVVSGEYDVEVQGAVLAKLTVKDFDEGKAEDGYLNGTFRITPKKALFEMMDLDEEAALMLTTYDPSLEFVMKNSKNASEMAINLYKDESLFFGLVFESKTGKADTIVFPENTVDGSDEEALMNWLDQIEGDTVEEKLESIGVPEEIMTLLNLVFAASSESAPMAPYAY